ncbi:MAG: hypothetical protein QGH60_21455 [Phycisphaerae bacterium]|jgi:hypothetical protein|nr:hypothetical protein [Phycisphaerae bacterium]
MDTKNERMLGYTQLWGLIWVVPPSVVLHVEALWFQEISLDRFWEENMQLLGFLLFLSGTLWLQRKGVKYLNDRFRSERSSPQIGRRSIGILLATGSFYLVLMLAASLFLHASVLWSWSISLSEFFDQKAQLLGIFLTLCVSFWIERTGEKWISRRGSQLKGGLQDDHGI